MDVADSGRWRVAEELYGCGGGMEGIARAAYSGGSVGGEGAGGGGRNQPSPPARAFRVCNLHTECPATSDTRLVVAGGGAMRCRSPGWIGVEDGGGPRPKPLGTVERRGAVSALHKMSARALVSPDQYGRNVP